MTHSNSPLSAAILQRFIYKKMLKTVPGSLVLVKTTEVKTESEFGLTEF